MNIDLDASGIGLLDEQFEALEERGTTDRVYSVGANSEYARPLEFGRGPIEAPEGSAIPIETESGTIFRKSVSGHPPYPWFRPAIWEFQANPESFVEGNTEYTDIEQVPNADQLVLAVAASLARQMERNVSAMSATDRSPGTHPEHPKEQTGNLKADIGFERIR